MNGSYTRTQIGSHVHFSHIPDQKFKHNLITVNFIMPLDAATASDNAVVPYILRKGCRECPDFSALNAKLNELYGARMSTGVSKVNGYQILSVSIRGLDGRFALDGEDLNGKCAALLASVVLDPKLENGVFAQKDTELERQFIFDSIESEINDKRVYAISRCLQTMFAGEPVAVRRYGSLESAGKITPESAYNAYKTMLEKANIEISFTGPGDPRAAAEVFTGAFSGIKRDSRDISLITLKSGAESVKEENEVMQLSQAKLVMGFRAGEIFGDEELAAMRMCSAMLGGTPFSKFFLNVREKLSLCYYCASNFDLFNRTMMVDSGIEASNRILAQEEILRQIQAVRDGDFTDSELSDTKLLVKNSVTTVMDSPASMESWYLSQTMRGRKRSPAEEASLLGAVTREAVVAAANKLSLDTVYFLAGDEDNDGAEQLERM